MKIVTVMMPVIFENYISDKASFKDCYVLSFIAINF